MTPPVPPSARPRGFSLIELMIARAIVGRLAAIAYPGYTRHVERARRAEARAALLEASHFMERYYAAQGTYAGASLPVQMAFVPQGSAAGQAHHELALESVTQAGYQLKATPVLADACGALGLNEQGLRTAAKATGSGAQVTVEDCWR